MSKKSVDPTASGRKEAGNSYLYEPFTTEDGIVVPPPARPMGPRRLARYYDEAADYLRALQRGDQELPELPMFMGSLDGVDAPAGASGLDRLSAMGSIDDGSQRAENPLEVELDVDDTRATVVEDPHADIVRQVLADGQEPQESQASPLDLSVATGGLAGEADFIALDTFEAVEEVEKAEEEAPEVVPGEGEVLVTTTGIFAGTKAVPLADLPQPVSAVDAQGLDLSALDAEGVTDLAGQEGSQEQGSGVESDSSSLIPDAEEKPAEDGEEPGEQTGQTEAVDTATLETDENPEGQDPHSGEGEAPQEPAADTPTASGASASGYATALVEEEKKGNKAVVAIGILVLLAMLFLVWVFFLQ